QEKRNQNRNALFSPTIGRLIGPIQYFAMDKRFAPEFGCTPGGQISGESFLTTSTIPTSARPNNSLTDPLFGPSTETLASSLGWAAQTAVSIRCTRLAVRAPSNAP